MAACKRTLALRAVPRCKRPAICLVEGVVSLRSRAAIFSFAGSLLRLEAKCAGFQPRRPNCSLMMRWALASAVAWRNSNIMFWHPSGVLPATRRPSRWSFPLRPERPPATFCQPFGLAGRIQDRRRTVAFREEQRSEPPHVGCYRFLNQPCPVGKGRNLFWRGRLGGCRWRANCGWLVKDSCRKLLTETCL
jgi:hypothetical protein